MSDDARLLSRFGRQCKPGTVLFREGEDGEHMFVLHTGRVRILKTVRGEERTLAELGPGEFFGEMAILNNKPRTATAVVAEEARLLAIDGATFEQMVLSHAEIAVRLIKKLARRLESADALIEILMHRDPRARVILGLCQLARSSGEVEADGALRVAIRPPDLAARLDLEEQAVRSVLRRLGRLGIVEEVDQTHLRIQDLQRLHEFLEFLEEQE